MVAIHAQYKNGDVAGALSAIQQFTHQHGDVGSAWQLRAVIERAAGDLIGSVSSFEQAVAAGVESAELLNSFGNLRMEQGEIGLAEGLFLKALNLDTDYVPVRINLSRLYMRLQLHDEAIRILLKAIQIDPSSNLALLALGEAYRCSGETALSVKYLRMAVALVPGSNPNLVHLGVALAADDQPAAAITLYDKALKSGYQNPQLMDNRAAAYLQLGQVQRALLEYDQLISTFPDYFAGHSARARLIIEYGLDCDPFASYRALAERYPSEPAVWHNWLSTAASYRNYQDILEIVEDAELAVGQSPGFEFMRGVAQGECGLHNEADKSFQAAEPKFGGQVNFLNARTRLALRAKEFDRASGFAALATKAAPHNQFAWAYLGLCWRLLCDDREFWLHDYDQFVSRMDVADPNGYPFDLALLAHELRGLHTAKRYPPNQSLRNGTQTEGALFHRKEKVFRDLRDSLMRTVRQFCETLPQDVSHPFLGRISQDVMFSGSWSVRLLSDGFHINHVHEQGLISSAMHIVLPSNRNGEAENAAVLQLGAPPVELGLNLAARRVIIPRAGAVVLFPSSMWHGTVPFTNHSERLTVAFDVVPRRSV